MYVIARAVNDNTFKIEYTNYKGERAIRTIIPCCVWFGATKYHKDYQFLLNALDVEKNEQRDFAMKDIHSVKLDIPEGSYDPLSLREDFIFPVRSDYAIAGNFEFLTEPQILDTIEVKEVQ